MGPRAAGDLPHPIFVTADAGAVRRPSIFFLTITGDPTNKIRLAGLQRRIPVAGWRNGMQARTMEERDDGGNQKANQPDGCYLPVV